MLYSFIDLTYKRWSVFNEGRQLCHAVLPCLCKYKGCCDDKVRRSIVQKKFTLTQSHITIDEP